MEKEKTLLLRLPAIEKSTSTTPNRTVFKGIVLRIYAELHDLHFKNLGFNERILIKVRSGRASDLLSMRKQAK